MAEWKGKDPQDLLHWFEPFSDLKFGIQAFSLDPIFKCKVLPY